MLTKRIIPCLDVKDGQVVKGKGFANLNYAGNPVKLARKYYEEGADELVLLDIAASYENRKTILGMVEKVAKQIFIPLTVGGGISTIEDIRNLLNAGADKVSINTAAINNPILIKEAAQQFGSQCIVIALDVKKCKNKREIFIQGGRQATGLDALEWAKRVECLGAGEILLTAMDNDGTKEGYDVEFIRIISENVNIPVIASGGAGSLESIANVFNAGKADAALAASIFHYGKFSIKQVKRYLRNEGVEVRI